MYGYLGVSLGVLNASLVEISIQGQPTSPFVLVTPSPPDALHSNYAAASMRCSDLTARICLDPVLAPVVIGSVFGFRFHHSFVMRPELPHYPRIHGVLGSTSRKRRRLRGPDLHLRLAVRNSGSAWRFFSPLPILRFGHATQLKALILGSSRIR